MKYILTSFALILSFHSMASEKVLDCSKGKYHVIVTNVTSGEDPEKDDYTLILIDQEGDFTTPDEILSGKLLPYERGVKTEIYEFKKSLVHKLVVEKDWDGKGAQIRFKKYKLGKLEYSEICSNGYFE